MKVEIYRHGINYFLKFYKQNGDYMEHCDEWISGFCDNPLQKSIDRARFWGCKSICIIF